ncbi:MAG: SIR2 family NAD-dependent protein deacylase [Vicinamibacteraceae bacterium]
MHDPIVAAAERIRRARRLTVLTGAGVSAASGVPTFRGADGLWRSFRPEELATPGAFRRDPRVVWEWYDWRRQLIAACRPNAAHEVLARWSRRVPDSTLVTQNVDGLHERAGTSRVLRLHGSIWHVRCARPCSAGGTRHDDRVPLPEIPPRCACGALLRPGVVWFGESLPADVVRQASDATARCDVFLAIGTSAVVYPAAGFIDEARAAGATTIEINPEATGASDGVDLVVRQPAEIALPEIDRLLQE